LAREPEKGEFLSEYVGVEGRIIHVNKEKTYARLESSGLGHHPVRGSPKHDIEDSDYIKIVKFHEHLNNN
jgi:hypothetical protein